MSRAVSELDGTGTVTDHGFPVVLCAPVAADLLALKHRMTIGTSHNGMYNTLQHISRLSNKLNRQDPGITRARARAHTHTHTHTHARTHWECPQIDKMKYCCLRLQI